MKFYRDPLRIAIAKQVLKALPEQLGTVPNETTVYELSTSFTIPPKAELGDFALPCFTWAKQLRLPPPQVAKSLAEQLNQEQGGCLRLVQAVGPYLNFFVDPAWASQNLFGSPGQGLRYQFGGDFQKTMVEYSQPNTHKELHVGHMRNACLGDAIVRLMAGVGVPVVSATFPGDVGTHVAKCLWYLQKNGGIPAAPAARKGEWLGRLYSAANLAIEDETDEVQKQRVQKELSEILHQLLAKQGVYYELWKTTREWSIQQMQEVYTWLGIAFDRWYWESEVDEASVNFVKGLHQQGKLVESEGAIGLDLNGENLGFCLLLKKDGTGLYATKDVELARRKFAESGVEKSIYVVDVRQTLHFQQVFRVLAHIGFSQAQNCEHLSYNFVELPDGAMSSRKGNIVPLLLLTETMEKEIRDRYLARMDWPEAEKQQIAHMIAQGAIRYGMLKIDTAKKIVFKMEEWIQLEGDSGPFIQYSAARIQSLLRKMPLPADCNPDWSLLGKTEERALLSLLYQYHAKACEAAAQRKPNLLCHYLLEVAQGFNTFYHACPMAQAETAELREARLALAELTFRVLSQSLNLLGIPTPPKM